MLLAVTVILWTINLTISNNFWDSVFLCWLCTPNETGLVFFSDMAVCLIQKGKFQNNRYQQNSLGR